eukprot:TRINITY_DN10951_c0_g1_i2.p1 TRINITY_DN10951_c0_g1~~TRINITY_DN10951_c0_g1_i2.p1  ORF type:complete len:180 (-),score=32.44 TRINITY_DN10951_c0_g1_i2:250-789(-)
MAADPKQAFYGLQDRHNGGILENLSALWENLSSRGLELARPVWNWCSEPKNRPLALFIFIVFASAAAWEAAPDAVLDTGKVMSRKFVLPLDLLCVCGTCGYLCKRDWRLASLLGCMFCFFCSYEVLCATLWYDPLGDADSIKGDHSSHLAAVRFMGAFGVPLPLAHNAIMKLLSHCRRA